MKNLAQSKLKSPRYLSFLSILAAVLWITCIVSQNRIVALPSSGYICAAVLPYPFLCIVFDMIAELYGFKEARKTLWLSFISVCVFVLSVSLFSRLPAPDMLIRNSHLYDEVMQPLLRILLFNCLGFIVGQYINVYIFSKLQQFLKGRFFGIRSIISTFIGDTLTFAIALFGDFSGLIQNHSIFILVIDELLLVYAMAIILAIPASLIVLALKRIEPKYNMSVHFNPFKS